MHNGLQMGTAQGDTRPERRHDIDWIRGLAVVLVVAAHAALVFGNSRGYVLHADETYMPLKHFRWFMSPWLMAILFVLSGVSTWYTLRSRGAGSFSAQRFLRLLLPFVFGTLMLVPPQIYCRRLHEGAFDGSYLAFYPHFFEGIYPKGNLTYEHLWFVIYLFTYSFVALPVFLFLKRPMGQRIVSALASLCERRGAIFLLAIPLGISESLLHAKFPWNWGLISDWSMWTWYFLLYVIGFIIACEPRFWRAIRRHGLAALVCGLLIYALNTLYLWDIDIEPGLSPAWTGLMFLGAFNTWFWVIALLAGGMKFLSFDHPLLAYIREASYPFYVLHQTILIILAYHVLKLGLHPIVSALLVFVVVVPATLLVYDLAVRRWRVMRFLFGLRMKPPASEETSTGSLPVGTSQ